MRVGMVILHVCAHLYVCLPVCMCVNVRCGKYVYVCICDCYACAHVHMHAYIAGLHSADRHPGALALAPVHGFPTCLY